MVGKEGETETIKRPEYSGYFSHDFIDQATEITEQGPEALMEWLDKNLRKEVRQSLSVPEKFTPENETTELRQRNRHAKVVGALFYHYAEYQTRINRRQSQGSKPERPGRKRKSMTVDQLRERQNGIWVALNEAGLEDDKNALDNLFELAGAIKDETNAKKAIIDVSPKR